MLGLIQEIKTAHATGLYQVALSSALSIPDVCAALESSNGETSRKLYIEWYLKNVIPPKFADLTAEECYEFRCKALHQASSHSKITNGRYHQIIFYAAKPGENVPRISGKVIHPPTGEYKLIDLDIFIGAVLEAAIKWWTAHQNTAIVVHNSKQLLRCFPNGLPWIPGLGQLPLYACIPPDNPKS